MQDLCAPSREELDRVHSGSTWLDIGVVNSHNLTYTEPHRLALWLRLGLSLVPPHVLCEARCPLVTLPSHPELTLVQL